MGQCVGAVEGCRGRTQCEERCEDGGYVSMMCLVLLGGVWEPIVKWRTHMFTIFTPFFTLGPASTTLYSTHAVSHGLISSTTFLQHSTVYSSTAVLQSTTSTPPLWPLQPYLHSKSRFLSPFWGSRAIEVCTLQISVFS